MKNVLHLIALNICALQVTALNIMTLQPSVTYPVFCCQWLLVGDA